MKYIIDFDHTLFDANAFIEKVEIDGRSDILYTPAIWKYYDVKDFLYSDVIGWLGSKIRSDLHILTAITPSKGEYSNEFQKVKLQNDVIAKMVNSISFVIGEKGESVASIAEQFPPQEQIVFIDDRIEQCLSVQAVSPEVTCCLMVRDPSIIGDIKSIRGIHVVHTLMDVDVIMDRI